LDVGHKKCPLLLLISKKRTLKNKGKFSSIFKDLLTFSRESSRISKKFHLSGLSTAEALMLDQMQN
jgi:hypothetical protein